MRLPKLEVAARIYPTGLQLDTLASSNVVSAFKRQFVSDGSGADGVDERCFSGNCKKKALDG